MKFDFNGARFAQLAIAVVLLGILAAILNGRLRSKEYEGPRIGSTIQAVRAQIGLYALQHGDEIPDSDSLWGALTGTTTFDGKTFGPYLQNIPVNPFNHCNAVGADTINPGYGWALCNGRFYGFATYEGSVTWIGNR